MRRFATAIFAVIFFFLLLCPVYAENVGENENLRSNVGRTVSLTDEEKNYIKNHPSVSIGYVTDRIPVSFSDDSGQLAGISRYIFDRVSELSGIKFEYVPLPSGDVTYDYLISNGFDLVSSVEYNEENQQARGILMSDPYFSSRKVVVAKQWIDFSYDADLSIAISTGSQTIRKVLGAAYPNFSLVDYPSITDCFDAVNSGEADLLMQNQYVVEHWIAKPVYEKLKVIPVLGLDDKLCFSAVVEFGENSEASQDEGRVLIDILNKAIAMITEDEAGNYTLRGVMENQYRYGFSDFLYRYRAAVRGAIICIVIIIILLLVLLTQHIRIVESKADAKVKSRFLSMMSHEIRTPLNGLIGLNYLMSESLDENEKMEGYIKQSDATAKYLLSLVNDMLDLSNLQNERFVLALAPVDLNFVVETVRSISMNQMEEKKLRFVTSAELPWPCVCADSARIQQVILHLLDNAQKFTPRGGTVSLDVSQEKLPDGKILTKAVVTDTGKGMSDEIKKHVFDAFARELDTVSKGNQGTGLGLSISRRLSRLMGGDLSFVTKKGVGSSFTFTFSAFPAESADEASSAESKKTEDTEKNAPKRTVLVAEDNELNAEILTEILDSFGYSSDLAEDGNRAVEKFEKSENGRYFAILMDLLMPGMDGFEAAKAIRSLEREDAAKVKIFACSANSSPEDRAKAAASGMDGFLTKPIDATRLSETLEHLEVSG